MAKKTRKPRSNSPRTFAQGAAANPATSYVPGSTPVYVSASSVAAPPTSRETDLAAEYQYVGKDLKRLAITAAMMFAVLIGINIVLNLVS